MVIYLGKALRKAFWRVVPHQLRSSGQFASGLCRLCGENRPGYHLAKRRHG